MPIDASDIHHCYVDWWKGPSERLAIAYQGIDKSNMLKHRINAADAKPSQLFFGKRFCIPLDFELLESHMPFFQAGLGNRLDELTFNDYNGH